ncbi:hypothetical protein CXG81DRAFT_28607 [Caulochytrium protostelioides]|uniref:MFS general substrate transporter n=1 Tax=Caulochytrium protostelioides TaxID=1555241 RepID=A0A4P9X2C8_9FUNG|nr:hypothetical protein CXG81DRAFT_28607 [Caulochytrium protostelioides]|eukprot:RKO98580.1 hypothetical protein CXG81DRAFT_28607 [Caulochytrium protostelioides]
MPQAARQEPVRAQGSRSSTTRSSTRRSTRRSAAPSPSPSPSPYPFIAVAFLSFVGWAACLAPASILTLLLSCEEVYLRQPLLASPLEALVQVPMEPFPLPPLLPQWLPSLPWRSTIPSFAFCRASAAAQARAAQFNMYNALAAQIPALLVMPVLGRLSDQPRWGRRLPTVSALVGALILTAMGLVTVWLDIGLWPYFCACIVYAFTGGWSLLIATGFAYVADVSTYRESAKQQQQQQQQHQQQLAQSEHANALEGATLDCEAAGRSEQGHGQPWRRTPVPGADAGIEIDADADRPADHATPRPTRLAHDASRTQYFAYLEAALFGGLTLGPYLGGLYQHFDWPMWSTFGLGVVNAVALVVYALWWMPESRPRPAWGASSVPGPRPGTAAPTPSAASTLVSPSRSHRAVRGDDLALASSSSSSLSRGSHQGGARVADWIARQRQAWGPLRAAMLPIMMPIALAFLAQINFEPNRLLVLYFARVMGWNAYIDGLWMLVASLSRCLCMLGLLPLVLRLASRRNGHGLRGVLATDLGLVRFAFIANALLFFLLAVVRHPTGLFFVALLEGLGALSMPTLRGILSRVTSPGAQGSVFACLGVVEGLGRVVSSLLYNGVYAHTVAHTPGMFLFVAAGLWVFNLVVSAWIRPDRLVAAAASAATADAAAAAAAAAAIDLDGDVVDSTRPHIIDEATPLLTDEAITLCPRTFQLHERRG